MTHRRDRELVDAGAEEHAAHLFADHLDLLLGVVSRHVHGRHHLIADRREERDLRGGRRRQALDAEEAYAIRRDPFELNARDIDDHIGVEIERPLNFVYQLRRDGIDRDRPAVARVLRDHAAPVGCDLRDREARMHRARYRGEPGEVPADRVRTAFDDVSRDDRACEFVPRIRRPLVPPRGGAERERRIGDAPADHDIRARPQCLGNSPRTKIRVGRDRLEAP